MALITVCGSVASPICLTRYTTLRALTTLGDDFVFQKLKDKREEDNDIANVALLSHIQDDLIPLFEQCKTGKEII